MPRPRPTRARARRCRRFLNAARNEEIIFTRNATEAINLVAYTFGRERIEAGDEIVLSIMEHHSNIVPWHFLRERQGAVIKWAPVDDEGNFLIDEFEKLLSPRTKMVAITHMSNMLGTLVPVKEVVRLAHARGIPVLVDGAQAAVHLDVDVQDIGCDFYAFTGHKLYGPSGIGVLYGKHEHLAAMPPFNGGGEMIREVFEDRVTYGEPPHVRGRHARRSSQAIGLGAAIDYVNSIGKARIRAHERDARRLCARAAARDQLAAHHRHGERTRAPIVSFEMKGAHPHDVATIIDRSGVAVRAGTHCVMPLLTRFGVDRHLPGVVRPLQHARGDRCPRAGADQGAGILRMTDESGKPPETCARRAGRGAAGAHRSRSTSRRCRTDELARLTDDIIAALKTVYDPEIPSDIYELGLIYRIDIADDRAVSVDMTLTTPNCPSAQELPAMVENAVASVAGVREVKVNIVWDPPWDPSRMSDEARDVSICGEARCRRSTA